MARNRVSSLNGVLLLNSPMVFGILSCVGVSPGKLFICYRKDTSFCLLLCHAIQMPTKSRGRNRVRQEQNRTEQNRTKQNGTEQTNEHMKLIMSLIDKLLVQHSISDSV